MVNRWEGRKRRGQRRPPCPCWGALRSLCCSCAPARKVSVRSPFIWQPSDPRICCVGQVVALVRSGAGQSLIEDFATLCEQSDAIRNGYGCGFRLQARHTHSDPSHHPIHTFLISPSAGVPRSGAARNHAEGRLPGLYDRFLLRRSAGLRGYRRSYRAR